MENSSRILLKRQPKSNSFALSFFGYLFLLLLSIVISYKFSNSNEEKVLTKKEIAVIVRENKNQYSINRFSEGFPETPLILGVYQSGNDAFYHQFKTIADSYANIKNVSFIMVNIKLAEEMKAFDSMRIKRMIQGFSLDDMPSVMFIYQNKELEKLRMPLQFTNLGDLELRKRIEGLINFSIKSQN